MYQNKLNIATGYLAKLESNRLGSLLVLRRHMYSIISVSYLTSSEVVPFESTLHLTVGPDAGEPCKRSAKHFEKGKKNVATDSACNHQNIRE